MAGTIGDVAKDACTTLQNKNILITGGTRGLGLMQVDEALRCGANHVTFTSRPAHLGGNVTDRDKAIEYLSAKYDTKKFSYVEADVRQACSSDDSGPVDDEACNGRVFYPKMRASLNLPPRLDAVSLNAGVFGPGDEDRRFSVLSEQYFENTLRTNCMGVVNGVRDFANALSQQTLSEDAKQKHAIVVIKSIYGSGASLFSNVGYTASKFCANGVTKQAAIEFARPEGQHPQIQVNSVSPGFAKVDLGGGLGQGFWEVAEVRDEVANAHPVGEWVDGRSVAEMVTFLLNPPTSVTGADFFVDNGVTAESIPPRSQADTIRSITGEACCGTVS